MKICTIIYSHSPYNCGGADIYAENISKHLAKIGHESIVITTKPYSGLNSLKPLVEYIDDVKIYRFYPFNIYFIQNNNSKKFLEKTIWSLIDTWNFHTYKVIKNILKKEKPDVVHLHTPISISLSVFNAIHGSNIPLILTLHEYFLLCKRCFLVLGNGKICNDPNHICKFYRNISRRIVDSKPDIVISPSRFALDIHLKEGFFKGSKHIVLPLGIELNNEKIEKNYKTVDILYIGTLSKHKGVHILINAFKEIKNKNIRLHILGNGANADEFKKMTVMDSRIVFHGFKTGDELMGFYKKANIVVVPSICYDNSPMVIYESFKYRTPVIGSRIGGIPELVEEGYNGFLFEAGDVDELKEILENLIENPSKLKRLEDGAFDSVKKYDMDEHIRKLEGLYEEASK